MKRPRRKNYQAPDRCEILLRQFRTILKKSDKRRLPQEI